MKSLLDMMPDAADKLEMVMDFGGQMPTPPADAECHDIEGCASWAAICRKGNNFYGAADSALVRGIVAIITAMVDGKSAGEIRSMNLRDEFASLNLQLGAGRLGGVNSMIRFLENL
ncbi:MAG: SufE family protein [Alphaproteobacteria bacterium]|nr:SufE family protein [Alphaproteobacteria bacterium]